MRLLIVSTLDSNEPFGAFTRPFYLGMYLAKYFDVYQVGLDCSKVDYTKSKSVGSRSLFSYIKAIQKSILEFQPDVIYAQQNLAGVAALIASKLSKCKLPVVFDFHAVPAFEHWTHLPHVPNKVKQIIQFLKAYISQGTLLCTNKPIVVAGESTNEMINKWYRIQPQKLYCIGNGVTDDLLEAPSHLSDDPYAHLRGSKIVTVVAPKVFGFPSNDLSVSMTIDIARYLENKSNDIHFVVIGRSADESLKNLLPANISFTGFLPERSDFLAHLHYADIGLLPFPKDAVAGGARNKALDYLACKKLVVSTPEGLRGLEEFQHNQHLLIAQDSIEEVGNTILDACLNLDNYQPLVESAYELIQEKYSWSAMAKKVSNVFQKEFV